MVVEVHDAVAALNELALADPIGARERFVGLYSTSSLDRDSVIAELRANASPRLRQVVARAFTRLTADAGVVRLLQGWLEAESDEFTAAAIRQALEPSKGPDHRRKYVSDLADAGRTYRYLAARLRHRVLNALPRVGLDVRRLTAAVHAELDQAARDRVLTLLDALRESMLRLQAGVAFDDEAAQFEIRPVAWIEFLRQLAMTYQAGWPDVSIEIDSEPRLERARVTIVPYLVEVAFRNVFDNARQAVAGPCVIRIAARMDARRLTMRVLDDGPGFSAIAAAAAFEVSFSTKEQQGRGLLEVSDAIARMGGNVRISDGSDGKRLELALPILK